MVFIGVDIEEVDRFDNLDQVFINKIFTKKEIEYCISKKKPSQHFAVRFAAKEAVIKAFSSIQINLEFNQIEIINDKNGAPIVNLKMFQNHDIKISLSHSDKYAIAFVLVQEK